jgi:hypothetical protein
LPEVGARLSRRALLLTLTDWRRCGMREAFGTGMRLPLIAAHRHALPQTATTNHEPQRSR